jgi:hypothetical protein
MKRIWTFDTAKRAVENAGGAVVGHGVYLQTGRGLNGLKACSAHDYLLNHQNCKAYQAASLPRG